MPKSGLVTILLANGFSIAYSVVVFSLVMAMLSSVGGVLAAIIIKNSLIHFNPAFSFRKAVLISTVIALAMLTLMYLALFAFLKEWMTFHYSETFFFWYFFPASIFLVACIAAGGKLNKYLDAGRN
jgi:hypothetical protein